MKKDISIDENGLVKSNSIDGAEKINKLLKKLYRSKSFKKINPEMIKHWNQYPQFDKRK